MQTSKKNIILLVKNLIIIHLVVFIILLVFSVAKYDNVSILQASVNKRPGGWGQSLERFKEIKDYSNIDILFVGSSHAYRGFDPRIFDAAGIQTFNAGSTSQTPLNTYFILKKYLKVLSPKLIIVELYPKMLTIDGYESLLDILTNIEVSEEFVEMSASFNDVSVAITVAKIYINRMLNPLDNYVQRNIENEKYIGRGYCESSVVRRIGDEPILYQKFHILSNQLNYVKKIADISSKHGAKALFAIHPIPDDYRQKIVNYNEMSTQIRGIIESLGADFYDFNYIDKLDSHAQFQDGDHLNASGVMAFNSSLINILKSNQKYRSLFD